MLNRLVFDIEITGHHSEYINHLVEFLVNKDTSVIYYFIVYPDFENKFPHIVEKVKNVTHINFIGITPEELSESNKGGLIKRSFSNMKLVRKYGNKYNVDSSILLYFNTFQFALAFFRPDFKISGILFLQFYRMSKRGIKGKIKYFRKYITTKLYTMNSKIENVFVLNDSTTAHYLNKEFNTTIFKMLPDPIPKLISKEEKSLFEYYKIDQNKKVFLHIGGLGERKGTFEILDSLRYLPKDQQKEMVVLLVGVINQKLENLLKNKIEQCNDNTEVTIIWDNRFVTNSFMKNLFNQCFSVLIPYKNTESSSGILGHSAAARKPVVATGKGLLGELVKENQLGHLIDDVTGQEIAKRITYLLLNGNELSFDKHDDFIKRHSPTTFSKLVTNN
jgi:glycosyltransferase involved in cell wall biosynthesis